MKLINPGAKTFRDAYCKYLVQFPVAGMWVWAHSPLEAVKEAQVWGDAVKVFKFTPAGLEELYGVL